MAKPKKSKRWIAGLLVAAQLENDATAAREWGVSRRTVIRYRKQLEKDPIMAQFVAAQLGSVAQSKLRIQETLEATLAFLTRAAAEGTIDAPMVEAISTAYGTISDTEVAKQSLAVYLKALGVADAD
jgi:hypothetical protein